METADDASGECVLFTAPDGVITPFPLSMVAEWPALSRLINHAWEAPIGEPRFHERYYDVFTTQGLNLNRIIWAKTVTSGMNIHIERRVLMRTSGSSTREPRKGYESHSEEIVLIDLQGNSHRAAYARIRNWPQMEQFILSTSPEPESDFSNGYHLLDERYNIISAQHWENLIMPGMVVRMRTKQTRPVTTIMSQSPTVLEKREESASAAGQTDKHPKQTPSPSPAKSRSCRTWKLINWIAGRRHIPCS